MGTTGSGGRPEGGLLSRPSAGGGPGPDRRILYGRRHGKPLRPGRRRLIETLLPRLALDPEAPDFDAHAAFAGPGQADLRALWLEIGFGGGEHLAWQAAAHPQVGLIGAEPFINGVARLLSTIERDRLDNIRVYTDDARTLIDALPEASIERCFLLFPDPWPKRRHHKRRFVRRDNLDRLARLLGDGAEFRVATDHMAYGRWILARLLAHPAFEWPAERADDWRRRPVDWPETRYEAKALGEGRHCLYFRFRRRPRPDAAASERP